MTKDNKVGHIFTFLRKKFGRQEDPPAAEDARQQIKCPRILAFADLHYISNEEREIIRRYDYKHFDVVVLLGDIMRTEASLIAESVNGACPCLYILGNHDTWEQYDGIKDLIPVDGRPFILPDGTAIGGAGGSVRYKSGEHLVMRDEQEMASVLDRMRHVDVLLTHDSPYGMFANYVPRCGFQAITALLEQEKPALHLFGHYHEPYETYVGNTKCVCVFRCAEISEQGQVKTIF